MALYMPNSTPRQHLAMNTFQQLLMEFALENSSRPESILNRLYSGQCYHRESTNHPWPGLLLIKRHESGHDSFAILIPFSPYPISSYRQMETVLNSYPFHRGVWQDNVIKVSSTLLPDQTISSRGIIKVLNKKYLMLLLGEEINPAMMCYYFPTSPLPTVPKEYIL